MATVKNRRILLARRPTGEPSEADFTFSEAEVEDPQPGQMLLRTLWLSLDPYMRGSTGESVPERNRRLFRECRG
jgi:NADPH-dependent curcumin reductase CurA